MNFSPFSLLYQNIAASMVALGLTHTNEAAFKTWAYQAWIDSGFTPYHAVLSQPASSTTIRVELSVKATGHRVNLWWGDGSSESVTPQVGNNTPATQTPYTHTYSGGALRPVVIIGRVKGFRSQESGGASNFGGRVQGFRDALEYLSVGGNNTLYGSVAGLTALTYLSVQGSNTFTGWETVAASATGLCHLYQRGVTVLTSTQVNAALAGFWANRDAVKPRSERTINLTNTGNGAPTGQGLVDKAALQAYKSPNNTGPVVWTVITN